MKKFSAKEIIIPSVSLFAIALVVTLLLAITNSVTNPLINELAAKTAAETRKTVLADAAEFDDGKTVTLGETEYTYCIGLDADGKTVGYVFTTQGKGYGGAVQILTGVSADGKITGVEILQMDETPGLGMNAKKEDFRTQFIGKSGEISVVKNSPSENEIQAITSATITSNAVTKAVNTALELYNTITGGGK